MYKLYLIKFKYFYNESFDKIGIEERLCFNIIKDIVLNLVNMDEWGKVFLRWKLR